MRSAATSLKLYSLVFIFTFAAFLIFVSSKTFAALEHDAKCEAIYINGTGVPNGGTYPNPVKIGEKLHFDIKMKNTGDKPWSKSQNYKLGTDDDGLQWSINRVDLPNNNSINSGSDVIFSFDLINRHTNPPVLDNLDWGILKERVVDASGNVIDAGGRFGQNCRVILNVIPANGATPANPTGVSNPAPLYGIPMTTQTTCVDNSKNSEKVAAKWIPVAGAKSYTTTFYEQGGATGFSGCLDSNKNSFTFSKEYSASEKYRINLTAYAGNNCDGGIVNQTNIQEIPNGYLNALSDGWKYDSIKFSYAGQNNPINFPLNTCSPFKLTLPTPTRSSDIPVKLTVTRYKLDDKLQQMSKVLNEPHTVIFRYQPEFENGGSE